MKSKRARQNKQGKRLETFFSAHCSQAATRCRVERGRPCRGFRFIDSSSPFPDASVGRPARAAPGLAGLAARLASLAPECLPEAFGFSCWMPTPADRLPPPPPNLTGRRYMQKSDRLLLLFPGTREPIQRLQRSSKPADVNPSI